MKLDIQLFHLLNAVAGQSPFFDGVIVFLASYMAYILIAFFLALVFFSQYSRREKLQMFLVAAISTVIAYVGITELIRFVSHRPRPFSTLSVHQLLADTAWSFPSGHATFFFALATVVYLYNKKWGIVFFIVTLLITMSRVSAGIHYPSDIVGGAFIGMIVAYATFYIVRRMTARPSVI